MADVSPFRGVRYAADIPLRDVISPPYDVLSTAQAAELALRSPYNAVHIDLPVPPGEQASKAAYARAAASFRDWLHAGVLTRDAEPALYLLEQAYQGPDGARRMRRGFLARLRLTDLADGVVRPHERTHSGPKIDRLDLYRAAHADVSPVFLLYADDDGAVGQALGAAATALDGQAWRSVADGDGTEHRLAALGGAAAASLAASLRGRPLYIADGHHRYATALAYRDERRAAEDHSADTLMVYLCAMNDPGLAVFPTHRLLRDVEVPGLDELLRRLEPTFTPVRRADGDACAQTLEALPQADRPGLTFALYAPAEDACAVVELRDPDAAARLQARGLSPRSARLPVTLLEQLVFADALGLDPAASEGDIDYAKGTREALQRLRAGGYRLGAFLTATSVDDVRAVADAGETMPQKSTYFYPKLLTGLVFDALGE